MNGESRALTQPARLLILVLYIVGLLVVSKAALGSWFPPTTEKGIWFFSALAALLLGNLLVTPFFTKPADAIAYAVAAAIALLASNVWGSVRGMGFDRFLWSVAMAYVSLVIITAIGTIVLRQPRSSVRQRLSQTLFVLSNMLGNPRAVFSVVFLFALVTYHRTDAREYLILGIAWVALVGMSPLEGAARLLQRWKKIWRQKDRIARIGEVVGHEVPGLVLIREDQGQPVEFGDVILVRSERGEPSQALALDHVGFVDGCWLRAIYLPQSLPVNAEAAKQHTAAASAGCAFLLVRAGESVEASETVLHRARSSLLGLVAPDTTISHLQIELIRDDLDVEQGSLVEVQVGSDPVLYQVIDGITKDQILQQKNTRGFVRAQARKVGIWDAERTGFNTVPWLPQPNQAVMLLTHQTEGQDRKAVGYFPCTQYPIYVDLDALITHNAAILGILGVGKTYLAIELVERMLASGIKVVCLDLTDQYAKELAPFYSSSNDQSEFAELDQLGKDGRESVSLNVEEGGSAQQFSKKLTQHLGEFLSSESGQNLKIYNPARFEVWRQDSRPYKDRASMATLTPTEITRAITEAVLDVLQRQGMTNSARCCLVYEEAHSLIPEWTAVASEGDKAATNGTAKAILQGRKFGLGCLVVTQRTANVTKSILNQCNTVFAMRVFDATGVEFLSNYIGEDYARVLSNLEDRHAVIFGRASSSRDPVVVRLNDRDKFLQGFRGALNGASAVEAAE